MQKKKGGEMESNKHKELRHKARRKSIGEGIFASARSSFGGYYLEPFAIAINSSNSVIALMSSISGLLGPLTQIFGSRLIGKYSRKKIILKSVVYECFTWAFFILVGFLFYRGILISALPLLLLLFFSFHVVIINFITPAWFSWHGDLVDEEFRGRWFSKRNLILGFVSIVLAMAAAFLLDYFKRNNLIISGFMFLFLLALVSRTFSFRMFKKMYEPKIRLKKSDYFSFYDFVMKLPESNFGKFTIFVALLNFAAYISLPFVTIYLLRYLKFSYLVYMAIIMSGSLLSLLFLEMFGKFEDRYGSYSVLYITAALIPIVPILWMLNKSPIYLALVPSLVSGMSWAGFELARKNFIYDNVRKEKRGFAVSYHNLVVGMGVFLGAGLGAVLINVIDINLVEPIVFIFLLGSAMRMIVVFFGIRRIKETKKLRKFRGRRSFMVMMSREAKPTIVEEFHEIRSIKDYLKK